MNENKMNEREENSLVKHFEEKYDWSWRDTPTGVQDYLSCLLDNIIYFDGRYPNLMVGFEDTIKKYSKKFGRKYFKSWENTYEIIKLQIIAPRL